MFDILINPLSGKGKSLAALKTVETILIGKQIPYEVHRTTRAGQATEIVAELNQKEECNLIVMGGDGTFNEALNGITDFSKITVGFIACGTGNDYIKATNIPKDPKKALELILQNNVGYTDFIQLDEKRALNTAGAGMDVDILCRYAEMKAFHGKNKYYAALLDVVAHLKYHQMEIVREDGTVEKHSIIIASASNGKYIGGGMLISPYSDVNDGLMDVVLVHEARGFAKIYLLLKFLRGKHLTTKYAETFRCKEFTATLLDENEKTQVDGEVSPAQKLHCVLMHDVLKTYK